MKEEEEVIALRRQIDALNEAIHSPGTRIPDNLRRQVAAYQRRIKEIRQGGVEEKKLD